MGKWEDVIFKRRTMTMRRWDGDGEMGFGGQVTRSAWWLGLSPLPRPTPVSEVTFQTKGSHHHPSTASHMMSSHLQLTLLSSHFQAMLSDWLHQESLHWNLDKLFKIKHLASWEEASRTQNASHTTSDCKLTVTVVRGDWDCQKYNQLLRDLRSEV